MALPSSSSSSIMNPTPAITFSNQTLIPSFPNEISIDILARVPRSDHPTLSLVSKAFHSLLSSPQFFTIRSLINSTETSLFITLFSEKDSFMHHQFYTLHGGRLAGLPPIPCSSFNSAYATLGPYIYVLGGVRDRAASNDVWIYDCRFNKWAPGPSMHVARILPMVGVVDGKLYVIGGCRNGNSVEVYDPDVATWDLEAVESSEVVSLGEIRVFSSTVIGRKIYAPVSSSVVAYDVGTRVWEFVDCGWGSLGRNSCCLINGVLYAKGFVRKISGFDLEERRCKKVSGVKYVLGGLLVENSEGNLVMFWGKRKNRKGWEVRCMEIDVKMDEKRELRGDVCLDKAVLVFPATFLLINCSAVTF